MRARTLMVMFALLVAACGDDGGSNAEPQLSEAQQVERYCDYFRPTARRAASS